jgi:hypothetical protein
MDNQQTMELCLALMKADSEEMVIDILNRVGLWNNPHVWRYYGDHENNYSTIGNQQSRPDAALVEKLVNSVDARLMNECLLRKIDPESPKAPQSIREAVALFFGETSSQSGSAGRIGNWSPAKRSEISKGITLAATGFAPTSGNPCICIADCGEGQTPEMIPETFLSLKKSIKLRIPFVQGKFNMGGTGALKFCGVQNLQLVISRRNPSIFPLGISNPSDLQWGFTIVRRESPEGNRRSSVYSYLAPLDVDRNPGGGRVLRFAAPSLPIFPAGSEPYAREFEWGTFIKLYEYLLTGKSHILMKDGLLRRLDLLLPEIALPVRLHECRSHYRGHKGSFETPMNGLFVRLEEDKGDNLEEGITSSFAITAAGQRIPATVYAFKKNRSDTYRKNEGVIFTVNGQTQGHLTTDFFRRSKVNLHLLKDSLLVMLDCTHIDTRACEDLFMNSRDRLSGGPLRIEIEQALEDLLRTHQGLRALREKRRKEELESRLINDKPLEGILEQILQQSPTLATLFLRGNRLSTPFKSEEAKAGEKHFVGKRHPTYFRFKGKDYGKKIVRDCHINMRCRIFFETDAANDYFNRDDGRGEFSLYLIGSDSKQSVDDFVINLYNGIATLSYHLPSDCCVGDTLSFLTVVSDDMQVSPFKNVFSVTVKAPAQVKGSPSGERRKPPTKEKGTERDAPSGIALPRIIRVHQAEWTNESPPFNQYTALRVENAGAANDSEADENVYYFKVNMDNIFLNTELKHSKQDQELVRARFTYGMVLLGMALLQEDAQKREHRDANKVSADDEKEEPIEDKIEFFSQAVAPVLLPTIESLGRLEFDAEAASVARELGEAI